MKKTLAILLALAMVFSTLTVAFAEGTIGADAQATVTLGMLKGEGNGVTADYLAKTPSRIQAAILFLRLKGLEDAAKAFTGTDNFADAKDQAWAAPIMAYLKAHPELGWTGVGDNKFNPSGAIKAQDYYKVMLESLGYKQNTTEVIGDFTYPGVFEFAAKQGLTKVATVTNFTNNDVAIATIEALKAKVKGADKTLAASLVDAKILDATKAQTAGVYTPAPTVLAVDSVSTNNLKTITVKFNKEVKDTTITDDSVKVYYSTTKQTTTKVLADDNKTLYIYMTSGAYAQMKDHKVVINGVAAKDNADDKITAFEKVINVADTTAPAIDNVVATSPKTLELYFSEPVQFGTTAQVYSSLKVDNVNTYVSNVDTTEYYTTGKVVLTLGTGLTVGNHTVKISGVSDYANFPITTKEFTVSIAADTAAPKIVSATMRTKTQIRVVFDEPVDVASVANTDFDVDGTSNSVASVAPIDSKTFDLNLGSSLTKAALVEIVIDYKGIKDHYGNQTSTYQTFTFKVEDDVTAPTLKGYAVTSTNNVEFTFSENVVNFDISDLDLYDKDGKVVAIPGGSTVTGKTIDGQTSKSVYVISLANKTTLSGAYTFKFDTNQDITDGSIRSNRFVGVDTAVAFNDLTAPTISSLVYIDETANDDVVDDSDAYDAQLTIYFSEAMDPATLANTSNYIFGSTMVSTMSNVTTTVASDNKSVTFVVNASSSDYSFAAKNIYVLAVKDAAGTILDVSDMNVLQTASAFASTDTFANLVSKIEATSKNTLKITMMTGKLIASIDPNKISFVESTSDATASSLQVMGVTIASDAKSAVLTLNNNLTENAQYDGEDANSTKEAIEMTTLANAIVLNTDQGVAASPANTSVKQVVADKIVPTVASVSAKSDIASNDVIVVDFNENVSLSNAAALYDLTVVDVTDDNTELTPTTDFTIAIVNGNLEITLVKTGYTNHKFSVTIDNGRYIVDGNGNNPANMAATVVENAAGDGDAYFTK